LATDELVEITHLDDSAAAHFITLARAHWFEDQS
jgi:hypothetical protein